MCDTVGAALCKGNGMLYRFLLCRNEGTQGIYQGCPVFKGFLQPLDIIRFPVIEAGQGADIELSLFSGDLASLGIGDALAAYKP